MNKAVERVASIVALVVFLAACAGSEAPTHEAPADARGAPATFVNKVWSVRESSAVAPGTLYVFLSDGTMVVTSPYGSPALGEWRQEGGALTWVEESLPYEVDVIHLADNEFRVRVHNPGEPVEIVFVRADLQVPKG